MALDIELINFFTIGGEVVEYDHEESTGERVLKGSSRKVGYRYICWDTLARLMIGGGSNAPAQK